MTNDQGPTTKDELQYDLATELSRTNPYGACRDRWNALAPEVQERLIRMRRDLLQHQQHGDLSEHIVGEYIQYLRKHLG